jgi:diketogulonate reductase-like aldo/keto reductase
MSTPSPASDLDRPGGTITMGGDMPVARLGFGAMRLTGPGIWGEPRDPAEARRVLERVVELGLNFIDTADSYGPEVSERLIAETLYPYPAGLVIATKGGLNRPGPDRWDRDARPERLRASCEGSLRRLKLGASTFTSCTRRTRACRSRTHWARSPISGRRGRSGTSVCRT